VYYRLGQWDKAIATLEHSVTYSACPPNELFFLAMAYQKLGKIGQARECYTKAVNWFAQNASALAPAVREELNDHRAEAQGLGLDRTESDH
jgi:tetratricopeptide (TPR) repeat protein